MSGRKNELIKLIKKYRLGKASPEEVTFLEKYYEYFDKEEKISQSFSEVDKAELGKKMFSAVQASIYETPVVSIYKRTWFRVAAAAAVLVAISVGGYLIFNNKKNQNIAKTEPQEKRFKNDVAAPAKAKATITLADGRVVALDSVANGTLATQGNVKLVKLANGQIAYQTASGEVVKEMQYNTLTNPRGSKVIDMALIDGSHVWLNAGSSVTYPVAFVGDERKVSITGEAYFEVTHNSAMPFKVSKGEMEVTDLGTSFNVNAYDDEADMKVTLLEGSIKIIRFAQNDKGIVMKPGEQAQVSTSIKIVKGVDVDEVMAWKNGSFSFDRTDITAIMRQISRWYDVEIVYENNTVQGMDFTGAVPRKDNVSEVLKMLEMTGAIHFKIDGKKIIVGK